MFEENSVNQEITNPEGANPASPAENSDDVQGQEQGTPQKPVVQEPQEEQKVPYERFKQVNDERKTLLDLLQRQQQVQQPIQQPQAPTMDEFANMLPEEQAFFRKMDFRYETKFQNMLKEKEAIFTNELRKRDTIIGNLLSRDFRRTHPDVKAGSEQEIAISQKIQQGYDPDDAYKVVMFDYQAQTAQSKAKETQQQQIQAKRAANMEQTSAPANNGLPPKKMTWKETASKLFDEEVKKGWE